MKNMKIFKFMMSKSFFKNATFKNFDKDCHYYQSTLSHFMKKMFKCEFTLWLNKSKF